MAKEYIEREAFQKELQEELDFDSPMYTEDQNKHIDIGLKIALRAIRKAPAADVVEVVRCKDCIKRKTPDCSMYYEADGEQYSWEVDDDFCSQGERRDNDAAD